MPGKDKRDISALYLDSEFTLWAAASEDFGDYGTFASVVYKVATVNVEDSDPIQIAKPYTISYTVDGFKIEALAAPTSEVEGSVFAIGTEDEVFGGVWRPLRRPPPRD
jgi:hypothetical protein